MVFVSRENGITDRSMKQTAKRAATNSLYWFKVGRNIYICFWHHPLLTKRPKTTDFTIQTFFARPLDDFMDTVNRKRFRAYLGQAT